MAGAPNAVHGHYARRFFRGIARAISDHRMVAHGLIPGATTAAVTTLRYLDVQHANVLRDQFPAETLMGLPPSVHMAIFASIELGAIVLAGLEILTTALGSRRLRELDIPVSTASPALGINLRGPILQAIGMETAFLAKPLAERKVAFEGLRDQFANGWDRLTADEQNQALPFLERFEKSITDEEARAAAAVPPPLPPPPPPLPGNPFLGLSGISVPPPPPSFKLAPGADPTMLSASPPPPRATVVPTTPGSAASLPPPSAVAAPTPAPSGPPVVLVPPPPPPKKEPSVIIKAGRRVGRALGMKRFQLPLPSAGGKPAGAPPRRLPISDPEFDRAFQAVKQAQEAGGDKEKALQILEELKKKNKLNPQQLIIADDYIGKLQSYLKTEKEMLDTPDPALELQLRTYLQQLNAAAKQKGDELSVAIVAGQGGISNDEATVVIQGVDQQIQERWQELQTLLAGETPDSIDQTKAIMAGELWESAPTVNIDQKLAKAFAALIKRAKPVDPAGLGMIERFFQEGRFKIVLTLLEKKSIIRQLRIAENDPRYREFLLLLESYTSGPGVI